MKIIRKLNNYLEDNEYKIIIKDKQVNIINYDEIIDFTLNKISIKHKGKTITIEGTELFIIKMVEDEVLISGNINSVRIN